MKAIGFENYQCGTDGLFKTTTFLACSPKHIDEVFSMLSRQPYKPQFTGGLEAALLTHEMAVRLHDLHPESIFFAYDTPNDLDPLVSAGRVLQNAGFSRNSHVLRCYVLIGYKGDSFEKAQKRMGQACQAGFMPFAMLYRDKDGNTDKGWRRFQREWANPVIVSCNYKKHFGK